MMDPGGAHAALRQAGAADSGSIAALHARLFSLPWDERAWHTLLTAPSTHTLCIDDVPDKGIVAFIVGRVAADEAEILSLGVAAHLRGRGHAGRLVFAFTDWSRRRGVKGLYLEVAEDNAAARAVYARAGFAEVGRRRGYYVSHSGSNHDALVLGLEL